MPSIALQFTSGRGTRRGGLAHIARQALKVINLLVSAVTEARESLACYRSLSRLSEAELRKRGLTRETVARFELMGRVY